MYKNFTMESLFDIRPTKSYGLTNSKLFAVQGKTPVVVNSSRNNGIGGYADMPPTEKGNIITFSDTTTADSIFYQPNDFIGYSHVQGVYPKTPDKWSKYALLYVVVMFRKVTEGRFNYSAKFNRKIAQALEVSLPITASGEIDYANMESYIRALEISHINRLNKYLADAADSTLTVEENAFLKNSNRLPCFKEVKLADVLNWIPNIKRVKPADIKKFSEESKIKYPFYGQSVLDNGVISKISLKSGFLNNIQNNVYLLVASNNHSINIATTPFYLKEDHAATSTIGHKKMTLLSALYIKGSIYHVFDKIFDYNSKATQNILKNTVVTLPFLSEKRSELDWKYMEAYIRIQQKLVLQKAMPM